MTFIMLFSMHSNTKLFADDVAIYNMINTFEDWIRLQEDLNCVSSWADKWQLKLNASKCEALLISRKCSPPKFEKVFRYHGTPDWLLGSLHQL